MPLIPIFIYRSWMDEALATSKRHIFHALTQFDSAGFTVTFSLDSACLYPKDC